MADPERTSASLFSQELYARLGERHHLSPEELKIRMEKARDILAELLDRDGLTSLAYTTKEGLVITINFFGHNGNGTSK